MEINGQKTDGRKYEEVFTWVRNAGNELNLVMQSSKKTRPRARDDEDEGEGFFGFFCQNQYIVYSKNTTYKKLSPPGEEGIKKDMIYRQLLGQEEIDYTVEKRFLQQEYEKKHGLLDPEIIQAGGTDLRTNKTEDDIEHDENQNEEKNTKIKFDDQEEAIPGELDNAFIREEDSKEGSPKKKRNRRKSQRSAVGGTNLGGGDKKKKRRRRESKRSKAGIGGESSHLTTSLAEEGKENADPTGDETASELPEKKEMSAESKKAALQALRNKTKQQRAKIIKKDDKTEAKKEKREKKTGKKANQSKREAAPGQIWDWENEANQEKTLGAICEEDEEEEEEVEQQKED